MSYCKMVNKAIQAIKIGEGTFGEAFKCEDVVFKIMPIDGKELLNGYPQRTAKETLPEIIVSQAVSNLGSNLILKYQLIKYIGKQEDNKCNLFAVTSEIKMCRGMYPEKLINEWRK